MSSIHISQIAKRITEQFSAYIDTSDLTEKDPEFQIKVRSRCLAAYAISMRSGCSAIDAARSVTDGGNDHGIDAVYLSSTLDKLYLVQSKWIRSGKGEPDSGDVAKFCAGVRDVMNLEKDRFNEKIQSKWDQIDKAVTSFGMHYELIVIYTGINTLAGPSSQLLSDLIEELNDAGPVMECSQLNQEKIHTSLAKGIGGEPIDLEIGLSNWGTITTPHNAFYGTVTGEEVAQWWKTHGESLFAANLRKMLGTTEVNREINSTIDNRPEDFWYFNNGITVVAKSIEKSMLGGSSREIGAFKAIDANVVNGAQTVSTLGRYDNTNKQLEHVKVPLRIISLEHTENDFGFDVTRANNRQNRIESRDFVSQDPEQLRLKTELALENIEYNLARSENFKESSEAFDLVEATTALACFNPDPGLAILAKREIGRFWLDITKAPYKAIFNPSINGILIYRAVLILRAVETCLDTTIKSLQKQNGREYGVLVHGNRLIASMVFDLFDHSKIINIGCNTFSIDDEIEWINKTTQSLCELLKSEVENHYKGGMLATIFKNPAKSKMLHSECLSKMKTPPPPKPVQEMLKLH